MALFLSLSPLLPLPSPLLESYCRKRHRKETWLPGKRLTVGLHGQELCGKMLCWAHPVTIYLDTGASSFFFRVALAHITIQTKEHSHFNLLIFHKEAFCLPYPKTMEITGKMFQIDNYNGNKENPLWSRDSEESLKEGSRQVRGEAEGTQPIVHTDDATAMRQRSS